MDSGVKRPLKNLEVDFSEPVSLKSSPSKSRHTKDELSEYAFDFSPLENNSKEAANFSVNDFSKVIRNGKPILLGSGALSDVYVVEDSQGNKFAMKEINKQKLKQAGFPFSIINNEVEILSKLNNAHIVRLLGQFETRSCAFLVTF